MKDFRKRLVSAFLTSLQWRWKDIKISTKIRTGRKEDVEMIPVYRAYRPTDPKKKYLEIFVHFPDDYILNEPNWTELATPIPQACAQVLYTLGLQVMICDAVVDNKNKCFTFITAINARVYQNLPPIPKQLTNIEFAEHFE